MSLRRRLLRASALLWTALLTGVGFATATMLHQQKLSELDQTLLAVARQEAHPPVAEAWVVEYLAPQIQVQRLQPEDPAVSLADQAEALATEHPLWRSDGDRRLVLLPVEVDSGAADRPERYVLVMAWATLPGPVQTVGTFALVYASVAVAAAILGVVGLDHLLRRALLPIETATHAVAQVASLQTAERLKEEGPQEVRALLGGVNGLLERLQRAAEAQARFTAEAAHELRTPLSGLRGSLEVALRRPRSSEEYRLVVEEAHRDVLAVGELVEALLAFARVDTGQTPDLWERERPAELLRLALRAEQALLNAAGNHIVTQMDTDTEIFVNRALVVVALSNLLRNAGRYAPGSAVRVGIREEHVEKGSGQSIYDTRLVFSVADDGPGLGTAEPEHLFDRFVRGGQARADWPTGTGLGLPLARAIARHHGGDCFFLPSPSCHVIFWLPIRTS